MKYFQMPGHLYQNFGHIYHLFLKKNVNEQMNNNKPFLTNAITEICSVEVISMSYNNLIS